MKNILEIKVSEKCEWEVQTNGNINDIVICSGDAIASLIKTLSIDSNGEADLLKVYAAINTRILDQLNKK